MGDNNSIIRLPLEAEESSKHCNYDLADFFFREDMDVQVSQINENEYSISITSYYCRVASQLRFLFQSDEDDDDDEVIAYALIYLKKACLLLLDPAPQSAALPHLGEGVISLDKKRANQQQMALASTFYTIFGSELYNAFINA